MLILDEVKVIGKVIWNSKNGKMVGLAMDQRDAPMLEDLTEHAEDDEDERPAEYFLQFLWRDLTLKFDVIGPHYSTVHSMTCAFTIACLMDALDAFQSFGFKVSHILYGGVYHINKHIKGVDSNQP